MALQTTKMKLPMSLDEVTPDWLNTALADAFPGADVKSVTRDQERAGTSTSARFNLEYNNRPDGAPDAVYVKGGFDPDMRRRVWAALIQEARFYAELAPDIPATIPTVHFAGVDPENKQGVIVMEDMTARGVKFGHITQRIPVDKVAEILTGQAKIHAAFWKSDRLNDYVEWAEPAHLFVRYLFREKHWNACLEREYAPMMRELLPDRESTLALVEKLWKINAKGPRTLLHGDCHIGNLYFEADGTPGFMDWQCTFPGTPGHDHAEMMNSALTVEDRRDNEKDLIEHYRAKLIENGVKDAPSLDDMWLSYRQNQAHLIGFSVLNPYDMQTVEVTDAAAIRSLEAIRDLDTLKALDV